ncbi:formate dehydrogenase subunit alpha [Polyangium sp. 15x6]|uniref:formate dehydrogenase subunit alpha n=1 Tax=Polyangium sp. 15x6 TaxID=3042687 RepID=UPI00249ADF6C|nr:formate dehydrogenase subunit alpha [Polyangium sp. 15x6]MDI3290896.1 formate dehydrogenase subunit alpha [Polyangium sp. 15x6]
MQAPAAPEMATTPRTVTLTIDGKSVTVPEGTTIWEAAKALGIDIPVLCHDERLRPVGVCRLCVVDVGGRTLAASCVRPCEPNMKVATASPRVERQRKVLVELLMSDQPEVCPKESTTGGNELYALARRYGVDGSRLPHGKGRGEDGSSKVISVHHDACILCDRCVRGCDEIQHNDVIGRTGKGYGARIGFDLDRPMGESTCVSCGECMAVCPTGALVNKPVSAPLAPRVHLKQVDSVCPYCGVGCALTYNVDEEANRIVYVDGRDGEANHERLCVKGRYGYDYAMHPQRLQKPLVRVRYPKGSLSDAPEEARGGRRKGHLVRYEDVLPAFREASWDEALDLVATRLREARDTHGPAAMAGFGSAKCSIEEAYVFQKLVRAVFGTNNVDHCTRLCHASSVAALLETIGSGAVTNTFAGIAEADVALLAGTNTTANHPVASSFFKQAAARGTKLIVVDPRRPDVAQYAWRYARIRNGTDVAFYNGILHVLLAEGLYRADYVENHTTGFEALKETVARYSPEVASEICGVAPDLIREIARAYGSAKAAITFWGMGISQHTHGTDNARCLISLCLVTGNVGRPGTGLHPLRGQNNVQGASDAGLIPMMYPDYQRVADPAIRAKFESAWGVPLDPKPGLTVTEITTAALEGKLKALYCMGENPFLSDPNVNKVKKALAKLDFLVVQDIFLTETAEFADVILPATSYLEKLGTYTNTDRRVQIGRPALKPPGEARLDWQIVCEISNRMGYPMPYTKVSDIFDEFTSLTDAYQNLDYDILGKAGRLWPAPDRSAKDGVQILFDDGFPTPDGRGKLVPCEYTPARETPDAEYPFVLNTGRLLEHWHTGTMTRRSYALDAIAPEAFVEVHPEDLARLGVRPGERVRVTSRRGSIELVARSSTKVGVGSVFIAFHFREAAANVLTIDAIDPFGKIPEFKFCAVRLSRPSGDTAEALPPA